ncbi:hypothetical protein [Brevibacterium sp. ZH18]|uniref:hypothetical protein n=1 Tax=Brevibacterium sp. ZH18 TaxID=2927784 RepID=UPI001F60D7BF|nr:hypothetical protein [Brevibacterium sp. ZH18]MCI4012320.1 hypothetical protein [Brevibacterium sp. ZH18]
MNTTISPTLPESLRHGSASSECSPAALRHGSAARRHGPGRIVERTTTITREIYLDDPAPQHRERQPGSPLEAAEVESSTSLLESGSNQTSSITDERVRGVDRAVVRLGVWLIELGRRRALRQATRSHRPALRADEIARRLDEAKARDLKHVIGLPR